VKKGFEPMTPGFRHVPYNDLQAMRDTCSPATIAVLIEGIQGEGGITAATIDYLLGLRALCDERRMLLMMDAVQDGHFRTGRFQAFQRIFEEDPRAGAFLPDAMSMAKSLGGGFPMGAFWVRDRHADLLSAGTHGTTFGGTPLACAVANKVFEIIERDRLAENARAMGDFLRGELQKLANEFPQIITAVRGYGFMLGFELAEKEKIPAFAGSDKTASIQFVNRLHDLGLLTVPSGAQKLRLLPPLNLARAQAEEGVSVIRSLVKSLAA
jgi:acetylornithine aminotransferase/acetylornithine/N-succinyldiaminopimelate aminotransferase